VLFHLQKTASLSLRSENPVPEAWNYNVKAMKSCIAMPGLRSWTWRSRTQIGVHKFIRISMLF